MVYGSNALQLSWLNGDRGNTSVFKLRVSPGSHCTDERKHPSFASGKVSSAQGDIKVRYG